ncbi:hypothetical protein C8J57DRAFT_1532938 [Mycena rebaudengoi]|nr:hypothetical protein C8J57DRAFT_1532938 [Mycena rebaudengoi]
MSTQCLRSSRAMSFAGEVVGGKRDNANPGISSTRKATKSREVPLCALGRATRAARRVKETWHVPFRFLPDPFPSAIPFAHSHSTIRSLHSSTTTHLSWSPSCALRSASRRTPPVYILAVSQILFSSPCIPHALHDAQVLVAVVIPRTAAPPFLSLPSICPLFYPPLPAPFLSSIQSRLRFLYTSPLRLLAINPLPTPHIPRTASLPIPSHPRLVPRSHPTRTCRPPTCPQPRIRIMYESQPDYVPVISLFSNHTGLMLIRRVHPRLSESCFSLPHQPATLPPALQFGITLRAEINPLCWYYWTRKSSSSVVIMKVQILLLGIVGYLGHYHMLSFSNILRTHVFAAPGNDAPATFVSRATNLQTKAGFVCAILFFRSYLWCIPYRTSALVAQDLHESICTAYCLRLAHQVAREVVISTGQRVPQLHSCPALSVTCPFHFNTSQ